MTPLQRAVTDCEAAARPFDHDPWPPPSMREELLSALAAFGALLCLLSMIATCGGCAAPPPSSFDCAAECQGAAVLLDGDGYARACADGSWWIAEELADVDTCTMRGGVRAVARLAPACWCAR